jgi:hypothetical protein
MGKIVPGDRVLFQRPFAEVDVEGVVETIRGTGSDAQSHVSTVDNRPCDTFALGECVPTRLGPGSATQPGPCQDATSTSAVIARTANCRRGPATRRASACHRWAIRHGPPAQQRAAMSGRDVAHRVDRPPVITRRAAWG